MNKGFPSVERWLLTNHLTLHCATFAILVVMTPIETRAQPQIVFPGSTPQGDYLRGVGVAAAGMGSYNLNTAQAESINVDTFIRWDTYVGTVVKEQTRLYVAKKQADASHLKELFKQRQEQILQSPEAREVLNGEALNAVLQKLLNSDIHESTFRASGFQVPLSGDTVRHIPFALSEKGAKFSMDRLSLKGKGKWSVALQDDQFQREKKAYERALDKALEQAIDGKMQLAAIEELDARADDLVRRLDEVLGPRNDALYIEAKQRLAELKSTVGLLKIEKIERAIGDIDKYSGTSINDLKLFMQSHNLHFAAAKSPEEKLLYRELYAMLKHQDDLVRDPQVRPGK